MTNRLCAVVLSALVGSAVAANARAGVSFTDRAVFTAALDAGYLSEDFEARSGQVFAAPLVISNSGFSASVSTSAQALLVFSMGSDDYLTTSINSSGFSAPVTIAFTSGNVTAFGGNFFVESAFGGVVAGTVTVAFSDGSVFSLVNQTASSFFGYVGDAPIASVTISPDATQRFVGIDDLLIGSSPIPGPASLGLLVSVGLLALRRRRS